MRLAIIGATGMLGRHAAIAAVNAGHDVIVTYRSPQALERLADLKCEARRGDLSDSDSLRDALSDVDAVINCAGYYPGAPRPWREEVHTATAQMENFYKACAGLPLKKIVYLGAAIALPRDPAGRPGHEELTYTQPPQNKNPYVQVKWAMDEQARQKSKEGLPVAIAIPTMTLENSIQEIQPDASLLRWRKGHCRVTWMACET